MQSSKFGIYLNLKEKKAVRVNSPYWIPRGKTWVLITPEVNTTLVDIREAARSKGLVDKPEDIAWGTLPPPKEAAPKQ